MKTQHQHLPKYEAGVHFLTAKTFQNTPYFNDGRCAPIFCEELEATRLNYNFHVLAFVVMPDHVHLLLWWDANSSHPDVTISKIAWAVKGKAARRIVDYLKRVGEGNAFAYPENRDILQPVRQPQDKAHYRNWQYKIWQKGAGYDFNVFSYQKLQQKVIYIHQNPVRAGLVSHPEAYPWSSASFYAGQPTGHPVQITSYGAIR
jgi:putative transposase